jgi:hypothetical protein
LLGMSASVKSAASIEAASVTDCDRYAPTRTLSVSLAPRQ